MRLQDDSTRKSSSSDSDLLCPSIKIVDTHTKNPSNAIANGTGACRPVKANETTKIIDYEIASVVTTKVNRRIHGKQSDFCLTLSDSDKEFDFFKLLLICEILS